MRFVSDLDSVLETWVAPEAYRSLAVPAALDLCSAAAAAACIVAAACSDLVACLAPVQVAYSAAVGNSDSTCAVAVAWSALEYLLCFACLVVR